MMGVRATGLQGDHGRGARKLDCRKAVTRHIGRTHARESMSCSRTACGCGKPVLVEMRDGQVHRILAGGTGARHVEAAVTLS